MHFIDGADSGSVSVHGFDCVGTHTPQYKQTYNYKTALFPG